MAVDFLAAVSATLSANLACATAFGDSPSTPKFQAIQAFKAELPYCRLLELTTAMNFQSAGGDNLPKYFERGTLQVDVFANSARTARTLGVLVAAALNDVPMTFDDGLLLELRISGAAFVPEPDIGAGVAVAYHRVLTFLYMIQRSL